MSNQIKRVLAVASAGGHWIQMLRLMPAFEGCEVVFVSTKKGNAVEVDGYEFHRIIDATRKTFWNFPVMLVQLTMIIGKRKPEVILTTGSAPGLMALMVGRLFRTRNIWIDSIANVDELSTSGKIARKVADFYLTQWKELARPDGPLFVGSVL